MPGGPKKQKVILHPACTVYLAFHIHSEDLIKAPKEAEGAFKTVWNLVTAEDVENEIERG